MKSRGACAASRGFRSRGVDNRLLDGTVHSLSLSVRPRVVGFREPVFDVIPFADHVKMHLTRPGSVTIARLVSKLDAVIGKNRVDALGHSFQQVLRELTPSVDQPCRRVERPRTC
jgi:hypothetical protein